MTGLLSSIIGTAKSINISAQESQFKSPSRGWDICHQNLGGHLLGTSVFLYDFVK